MSQEHKNSESGSQQPSKLAELDDRMKGLQNELALLEQQRDVEKTRETRKKYFDVLTEDLDKFLGGERLTEKNLASANFHLMQKAQQYPELQGMEKKTIVLDVLDKRVQKDEVNVSILSILAGFIDTIVDVDKGEISLSIDADEAVVACCGICARGISKKSRR